jgi:hypothetical protein
MRGYDFERNGKSLTVKDKKYGAYNCSQVDQDRIPLIGEPSG